MKRVKWKGPYYNLIQKLNTKNFLISRNSEILPKFIGLNFQVHNGKTLSNIFITNEMVGHKFGEFVFTRKKFKFKKKLKK